MLEIIPTTLSHLRELAVTMRDSDRKEVESMNFSTNRILHVSFKKSVYSKTALIDGKVAACFGVNGVALGHTGEPWLLTSNEVYKISPIFFVNIYKQEITEMLKLFLKLENFVDAEYTNAIRLLKIVGFKIGEPELFYGATMRKFTIER